MLAVCTDALVILSELSAGALPRSLGAALLGVGCDAARSNWLWCKSVQRRGLRLYQERSGCFRWQRLCLYWPP
jgi:hypothetical protein